MKMQHKHIRVGVAVLTAATLTACKTVKLPDVDNFIKSPQFSEEAAKIATDYPDVSEAPQAPTDVRSSRQWDKDAKALQALRDDPDRIAMESGPDAAASQSQYDQLKAKVQAYKKDDPTPVTTPSFPNYTPRR